MTYKISFYVDKISERFSKEEFLEFLYLLDSESDLWGFTFDKAVILYPDAFVVGHYLIPVQIIPGYRSLKDNEFRRKDDLVLLRCGGQWVKQSDSFAIKQLAQESNTPTIRIMCKGDDPCFSKECDMCKDFPDGYGG
jgi:hypothetical protein